MLVKVLRDREGERRETVVEGLQMLYFQGKFNSSINVKLEMCAILRN